MIHVAGSEVSVNARLRQRCSWCGAVLIDIDLRAIAVPVEQAGEPYPTWPVGKLIGQEGAASFVLNPENGDTFPIPDGCCMALDPEATR